MPAAKQSLRKSGIGMFQRQASNSVAPPDPSLHDPRRGTYGVGPRKVKPRRMLANGRRLGHKGAASGLSRITAVSCAVHAVLPFFAAPLLLLGGCQTIASLGDHAAATVGLGDDAPKTYTASEVSKPSAAASPWPTSRWRPGPAPPALASGGSAVDAVTAMFFALTATYPVAAGLGARRHLPGARSRAGR